VEIRLLLVAAAVVFAATLVALATALAGAVRVHGGYGAPARPAGAATFVHRVRSVPLQWVIVFLIVLACGALMTIGPDARWLAALGDLIVQTHGVPSGVPYASAFSSGWHNVPVLGELIFSGLEHGLGDQGLILAQATAVAVALAVVARGMPTEAGIVLLLVPLAAANAFLVVRAQLFSVALFPLLLVLLHREAAAPSRRIWWLVPLIALWGNLHGGVLIGLVVATAYLLLDRLRHDRRTAVLVLLASVAAVFVTPAGVGTAAYYQDVFQNVWLTSHQGLWATPSLRQPADLAFLAGTLPLALLAIRSRPRAWECAAGAALALAAANAARNEVWLVLFLAPLAVRRLHQFPRPGPAVRRALALLALVACAGVLVLALANRPGPVHGAGLSLRQLAIADARGTPILANPYDAEQLALQGAKIVIGDPIDAFTRHDQRLYWNWLRGSETATAELSAGSRVILIGKTDAPQRVLAHDSAFCEAAADRYDILYLRCLAPSRQLG
jgi:hypothetical protein